MKALTKPLACAVALLASAFAGNSYAAGYNYSVTLGITTPKGSSAEIASKDKTLPAGVDFSPCWAKVAATVDAAGKTIPEKLNLDQLAFTIKFDAGKKAEELRNVYVIFSHPDTGLTAGSNPYLALSVFRDKLTNSALFKPYATAAGIQASDTYAAATTNLGYAQTETILGGNIPLEGLSSGLWLVTAIIGGSSITGTTATAVNFDDPSTWDAWDSKPFMLGKPWKGTTAASCE